MNPNSLSESASRIHAAHFFSSAILLSVIYIVFIRSWFPYPYERMLGFHPFFLAFFILYVFFGPILIWFLYYKRVNSQTAKKRWGLIAIFQLLLLGIGLLVINQIRPIFLVAEVDRFKVISRYDLRDVDFQDIPAFLSPQYFGGPRVVFAQFPNNPDERLRIFDQSISGGPDLGEQPKYYTAYDEKAATLVLKRSKPLQLFLDFYPAQAMDISRIVRDAGMDIAQLRFVPVMGNHDWIAVINSQGFIVGFLEGDGFISPISRVDPF